MYSEQIPLTLSVPLAERRKTYLSHEDVMKSLEEMMQSEPPKELIADELNVLSNIFEVCMSNACTF